MDNIITRASFTVNRKILVDLLKQIKLSQTLKNVKTCNCELTLTDNQAAFVAPGAHFFIPVVSTNTAKATFALNTFVKLINTYDKKEIGIEIHPGYVKVETFKLPASVTFIEDDKILRSIDLPINYTEFDLLMISHDDRYTQEELDFNKLTPMISEVEKKLEEVLETTDKKLRKFGITKEDMKNLLEEKIQRKLQLIKSPA